MRVPPDQSGTLAEQAASASSGSRSRSARVTLVSRVPNRNVLTRFARIGQAMQEMQEDAGCTGSSSPICRAAPRSAAASIFGPTKRRSMKSPPPLRLPRKVRRMSIRWPRGCGVKPPRAHFGKRQHQPLHRRLGGGDLGIASSARSLFSAALRGRRPSCRVSSSISLFFFELVVEAGEQRLVDARRAGLAAAAASPAPAAASSPSTDRYSRGGGRKCGTPDRTAPNARAASRTPRAASSKNPRACRCPPSFTASSASSTAPGPTGMPAARSARAKYRMFSAAGRLLVRRSLIRRHAGLQFQRVQHRYSAARSSDFTSSSSSLTFSLRAARCRPGI